MNQKVLKLIPNELSIIGNPRKECTVSGCTSTFGNISNLQMHLNKHHRIETKSIVDKNTIVQHFCPIVQCKYNSGSHFFKSRKYLKQHYLKVHAVKNEKCLKCNRSFACATLKKQHERSCGVVFQCVDCDWSYTSRECLLTHCRRKGHRVPSKQPVTIAAANSVPIANIKNQKRQTMALKPIAPKAVTVGNQTSPLVKKVQNILKSTPAARIRANFEQIMLKNRRKQNETKISQTTQTASLYNDNCKKMISDNENSATKQATSVIKNAMESNTNDKYKSLDLIDEESNTMTDDDSAQANKNLNNLNYVEDDSNLHYFTVSNFNAGLCHIETQTELMFDEVTIGTSDMDPLLCHMHTQTSDEILNELGLTNIQTQTNWPDDEYNDLFVSAETQTCNFDTPFDNISIQTQTSTCTEPVIRTPTLKWSENTRQHSQFTQTQME